MDESSNQLLFANMSNIMQQSSTSIELTSTGEETMGYGGNNDHEENDEQEKEQNTNIQSHIDTHNESMADTSDNDNSNLGIATSSMSRDGDDAQEGGNEMPIEERQIHDSLLRDSETAQAQLEETLNRVRETTKTMLDEIKVFLESTEGVMIDYTKCQNSQRDETRRLEEVEPDVLGATEMYLAQMRNSMA